MLGKCACTGCHGADERGGCQQCCCRRRFSDDRNGGSRTNFFIERCQRNGYREGEALPSLSAFCRVNLTPIRGVDRCPNPKQPNPTNAAAAVRCANQSLSSLISTSRRKFIHFVQEPDGSTDGEDRYPGMLCYILFQSALSNDMPNLQYTASRLDLLYDMLSRRS